MVNRHVCIEEWFVDAPYGLSGSDASSFLLLDQQPCDSHQVIRQHSSSDQEFEMLPAFGKTPLHASSAKENGDSSLDAGPKALPILEARAFLVSCLSRRFSSTTLGNAHDFDPGVLALLDVVGAEESAVGTVKGGSLTEGLPMGFQRGFDVTLIRWVPVEHAVLGDQAPGTLSDVDFVPKFNRLQDLAPLDQIGMSLEDRKDLLLVRNLLSVKHAATTLINDAVSKAAVVVSLVFVQSCC